VWYVWGHLDPTPIYHDEASYVFQAMTFASGNIVNPPPPLAEFFEQFHVIVNPVFASKYPPGNGLALTPGAWLGIPAIGPVVLAGLAAGLLVSLAARMSTPAVALLTWLIWLTAQRTLSIRASYFSENVSGTMWLAGWWAVLKWQASGRQLWLLLAGAAIALMTLTRPLTGLAYSLPLIATVLFIAQRQRLLHQLAPAAVLILIVGAIGPMYNQAVTNDWKATPWMAYAHSYSPFERLGFGFDESPPSRILPDEMLRYNKSFEPIFRSHTLTNLPRIAVSRIRGIVADMFEGWRLLLLPAVAIACTAATVELTIGIACTLCLFLCYLSYAHYPTAPYYVEAEPLLAFLAASGLRLTVNSIGGLRATLNVVVRRWFVGALTVTLGIYLVITVNEARNQRRSIMQPLRSFFERGAELNGERRIVFIRHRTGHNVHLNLIRNHPDLARTSLWYVRDRGPDNSRLLRMFPDRIGYLYSQEADIFEVIRR
jgi:hypothetical protein